jgi:hypothetical protein
MLMLLVVAYALLEETVVQRVCVVALLAKAAFGEQPLGAKYQGTCPEIHLFHRAEQLSRPMPCRVVLFHRPWNSTPRGSQEPVVQNQPLLGCCHEQEVLGCSMKVLAH